MACPHVFRSSPHYCSYIQVPELLQFIHPLAARVVDARLLWAVCSGTVLWLRVLEQDLAHIAEAWSVVTIEGYQDLQKRIERALAIDELLLEQLDIARLFLLLSQEQTQQVRVAPPRTAPWASSGVLSTQLTEMKRPPTEQLAPLAPRLQNLLLMHQERFARFAQQMEALLEHLFARSTGKIVSFEEFVPPEIAELAERKVAAHHAAAETAVRADAHMFIIIHQIFEIWFGAAIVAVAEAITALTAHPPQILTAEGYARRLAALVRYYTQMIRLPQTMTAADYLAFRHQILGGSGAESIQFRMLEVGLGLRDPGYRSTLEQMRLLTPAIEELFEVPSLAQAFLQACASRGVEPTAQDLSRLFCPTGTENPHADLMGLAEALLDTEQWLQQWRGVHLLMVDRMIGNQRASLGVGGQTADGRGDSKPYLLSTLDYSPIFPELWAARNYVQANRRTTGTASRPRAASGCSS